jgi:hypothetical protein
LPNVLCILLFLTFIICISFSAEETSKIGCWSKEETLRLENDVERWLVLKPRLDGRLQLVLGLDINEFSSLFTSWVCTFLFSCKENVYEINIDLTDNSFLILVKR